jgi:hypothetical protein
VRGTLTSPLTTATSTDIVCFEVRLTIENSPSYDRFRLYIEQGSTRRQIWDKSDGGFSTADSPENPGATWDLYTTSGNYVHIEVPIGTPSGINLANPVRFEFDFQSIDGNYNRTEGIYLDNIIIPCGAASPGPASSAPSLSLPSLSAADAQYMPPPADPEPKEPRQPPSE